MDFNPRQNANANDIRRMNYYRSYSPVPQHHPAVAPDPTAGYSNGYFDGFRAALQSLDINSPHKKRKSSRRSKSEKKTPRHEAKPPAMSRLFAAPMETPPIPQQAIATAVEQQMQAMPAEDQSRMRVRAVVEVPQTRTVRVPVTVQEEVTTMQRRQVPRKQVVEEQSYRLAMDPFTLKPVPVPAVNRREIDTFEELCEPVKRLVDVQCYRIDQVTEPQLFEVEGVQEFDLVPRQGGFRVEKVTPLPGTPTAGAPRQRRHMGHEAYRADVQDDLGFLPLDVGPPVEHHIYSQPPEARVDRTPSTVAPPLLPSNWSGMPQPPQHPAARSASPLLARPGDPVQPFLGQYHRHTASGSPSPSPSYWS